MDVRIFLLLFIKTILLNTGNAFDLEECHLGISLKGQRGDPGFDGPKGDKGFQGPRGIMGERGDIGETGQFFQGIKGERGENGEKGLPSLKKGEKGERGHRGDMGDEGEPGDRGHKGEKGDRGLPGMPGPEGEPGVKGKKGRNGATGTIGPSGLPGLRGKCLIDTKGHDGILDPSVSTEKCPPSHLLQMPCKFELDEGLISGCPYEMGTKDTLYFEAYCNTETLETCIRSKDKVNRTEYLRTSTSIPVYLGVDVKELYKLNKKQITWLQQRSEFVRQTIKFWYKNLTIYSKENVSKSIQFLTWSDVVIGSKPTKDSPSFYSVPAETDGVVGDDTLKSTVVHISSTNKYRLPITDVLINERGSNPEIYIENVELCFA